MDSFDVWTRETGQWALSARDAPTSPSRNTVDRFLLQWGIRVFESLVQTTLEPVKDLAADSVPDITLFAQIVSVHSPVYPDFPFSVEGMHIPLRTLEI